MTKTEFHPKCATIPASDQQRKDVKAATIDTAADGGDQYAVGSQNTYRGLLNGKAQTAFGALTDAVTSSSSQAEDPIQSLLGDMMVGGPTNDVTVDLLEHELPDVPDVQREILQEDPDRKFHMQPVIERYAGLEKVILTLMDETQEKLTPQYMSRLTSQEIATLREYNRQLASQLWECREQLRIARLYDTWAEQEIAAAKEAKEA